MINTHAKRQFQLGDQVLVLLPTSTNKLLAEWQGPFSITKRLGKVDYEVHMPNRRKLKQVFHVNMLHKWHSPTAISCWADEIADDDGDDIVTWLETDGSGKPDMGDSLSPDQIRDI